MSNKTIKEEYRINFYINDHKSDFITLADTIFNKSIKLNNLKSISVYNEKKLIGYFVFNNSIIYEY